MRNFIFTLGLTLFCFISSAQTSYYYYYKGEKQYLTLNTEYAFLSLKEQQLLDSIREWDIKTSALCSNNVDKKQYQTVFLNVFASLYKKNY